LATRTAALAEPQQTDTPWLGRYRQLVRRLNVVRGLVAVGVLLGLLGVVLEPHLGSAFMLVVAVVVAVALWRPSRRKES